jgi:hypothetical protein
MTENQEKSLATAKSQKDNIIVDCDTIQALLNYQSIKIKSAEIVYSNSIYKLLVDNQQWMSYNPSSKYSAKEQIVEANLAYGNVITTGLGLAIKETLLLINPRVSALTVYEKSSDVVEIFYELCRLNNFNTDKLTIINDDAELIPSYSADCIFLDHYENEPIEEIETRTRAIALKSSCDKFWYWPALSNYFAYVDQHKHMGINHMSFKLWSMSKNIKNLINKIPRSLLKEIQKLYCKTRS